MRLRRPCFCALLRLPVSLAPSLVVRLVAALRPRARPDHGQAVHQPHAADRASRVPAAALTSLVQAGHQACLRVLRERHVPAAAPESQVQLVLRANPAPEVVVVRVGAEKAVLQGRARGLPRLLFRLSSVPLAMLGRAALGRPACWSRRRRAHRLPSRALHRLLGEVGSPHHGGHRRLRLRHLVGGRN